MYVCVCAVHAALVAPYVCMMCAVPATAQMKARGEKAHVGYVVCTHCGFSMNDSLQPSTTTIVFNVCGKPFLGKTHVTVSDLIYITHLISVVNCSDIH